MTSYHPSGEPLNPQAEVTQETIDAGMRRFKIRGGSNSLCQRCTHSHIIQRARKNDLEMWCRQFDQPMRVGEDIVACNRFRAEGTVDIFTLANLAKVIENRPYDGGDYR